MIEAKNNVLNSPVRKIEAKVELYNGSTLAETYTYTDAIKNIKKNEKYLNENIKKDFRFKYQKKY